MRFFSLVSPLSRRQHLLGCWGGRKISLLVAGDRAGEVVHPSGMIAEEDGNE